MKIYSNPNISRVMNSYGVKPEKVEKADSVKGASDKIEISEAAKDFQVAMKAFKELPEIREAKVAALKEQIDSGQYNVSGKEVADRILAEAKINKLG